MNGTAMAPARIEWVDRARGLGIVLVVLGHTSTIPSLNSWIYAFHMPFFFWMSGFLYKSRPIAETLERRARTLLVPYFFFGILTWVYWAALERNWRSDSGNVWGTLVNIFVARAGSENYAANVALWFLPCLFLTEVVFAALMVGAERLGAGLSRWQVIAVAAIALVCLVVGLFFTVWGGPRLPWTLDIVPIGIGFYALGNLCRRWSASVASQRGEHGRCVERPLAGALLGLTTAIACANAIALIVVGFSLHVDLNNLAVHPYMAFVVAAGVGVVLVTEVAKLSAWRGFAWLGRASLVILCLHEPVKRVAIKVVSVLSAHSTIAVRDSFGWVTLCVIVTLAACSLAATAFSRWAPALVGLPARQAQIVAGRRRGDA